MDTRNYPIVLMQDRYHGVYSGGRWLAIASASDSVETNVTRAQFCLIGQDGPSDSDVEAAGFWQNPPDWIAVGDTPDQAIEALRKNASAPEARTQRRGRIVFGVTEE